MRTRFGIVLIHLAMFSMAYTAERDFCSQFTLIPRSNWSRVPAKCQIPIEVPVDYFFVHVTDHYECSNVSECSKYIQNLQTGHIRDRKWCDIAYSFLVGGDGNVYEGTGWSNQGFASDGHNKISFAVSFMGNFSHSAPNEKMLKAAQNLIACGVQTGKIKCEYQLKGHRDVSKSGKPCPNDIIYGLIQKWPRFFKNINNMVTPISLELCKNYIVEVQESFCDFEKDFCEWRQEIGSQFDWIRRNGIADRSRETGPLGDRQRPIGGFYILADASNNTWKQTKLCSPSIPIYVLTRAFCFTFYYMMFGKDMGTLQLRVFFSGYYYMFIKPKIIWERKGPQKHEWIKQAIQLNEPEEMLRASKIHFEFTAKIGFRYLSDIALDDISIKRGKC